jgi:hypothetical protein
VAIVAAAATLTGGSLAAAAPAPKNVVQRIKDPGTGLEVRVEQARAGDVAFEINDRDVTVRRELSADRLVTTVSTRGETIAFALDRSGLLVSSPHGRVRLMASNPEAGRAVVQWMAASPAMHRATALLARVHLGAGSAVGHTLMLTRAFLLSATGERDAALTQLREARASLETVRVAPARFDGPGDCWDAYAREAIAAIDEYQSCMRGAAWYDLAGQASCGAIYDMRAIGAFSWWVSCVGLRGAERL